MRGEVAADRGTDVSAVLAEQLLALIAAPADRVARQLLQAAGGPGGTPEPMDEWMLSWLAGAAELLVTQAPPGGGGTPPAGGREFPGRFPA